mmetsp:Transcript_51537/g.95903  ORF Transcript_51537/g.95903 Transcript_51537/m.95903 type:complete len:223 (-) Transcript_51537:1221-1889(-)
MASEQTGFLALFPRLVSSLPVPSWLPVISSGTHFFAVIRGGCKFLVWHFRILIYSPLCKPTHAPFPAQFSSNAKVRPSLPCRLDRQGIQVAGQGRREKRAQWRRWGASSANHTPNGRGTQSRRQLQNSGEQVHLFPASPIPLLYPRMKEWVVRQRRFLWSSQHSWGTLATVWPRLAHPEAGAQSALPQPWHQQRLLCSQLLELKAGTRQKAVAPSRRDRNQI